ncbi:NAD(P)-dependent oxidoreductase [Noviherbaspirillum pedocola]|uniref:NAD(P)-dependent oxidoreductase n=1 Tax=Noviherbaspirillum pedocola TaxID=2801341 RepID=A0A934SZY5_9BURK|nr:NAD(P)-dependent oxidoreductase [Noviherbaspirillum pedocola]MBK4738410.1 NAD(P)-dependent oxidoreductase [Noviherbaspirillum pedocola]
MDIGFIGLGHMGEPLAANLLKAGHRLVIWNRSQASAQRLAAQGAQIATTPEEALGTGIVFSMLADNDAIRAVLIDSGVMAKAAKESVHVNMSTISVAYAQELTAQHEKLGITYIAAPVLGRPDVAAAGKLNILAAGPAAAIDRVQPLLDVLGQKTWRLGETASHANVIKLAANVLLASAVETIAETATFVSAHGVAAADLLQIISNSTFPGPVYQGYGKLIVEDRFDPPGFKAGLALKDVRLALAASDDKATPMPIASLVRDSLLDALAHQEGDKDLAVLGRVAARRAGR